MKKKLLREKIRNKRENLSEEYKKHSSEIICSLLEESSLFKEASDVFIYISTDEEPNTENIIKTALTAGKTVYVPKCIKKGIMVPVRITPDTVFSSGYMGIKEPVSYDESIRFSEIGLSVIPCVSVSLTGERLGHGAGFYDIFLQNTVTHKVCLCFSELISKSIPTDKNDIPMDTVITEKGIFTASLSK